MKRLVFNSSLPRAGSTLLQNIFAQNPKFYCTPTSGTLELIYGARANFTNEPTFKAQDKQLMEKGFQGFCFNGLHGFYNNITDCPYVLEKSRGWGIHYDLLKFILRESPKIICMVRDLKQIAASIEKKYRANPQYDPGFINHSNLQNTSTPKRVEFYLKTPPLGLAMERLNEIFRQGIANKILFIRYEDLCENPHSVIQHVYNYLEVDSFNHDFTNIKQVTQEDDSIYGPVGDHKIRPKIEKADNNPIQILGQDVCNWLDTQYRWYREIFNYL